VEADIRPKVPILVLTDAVEKVLGMAALRNNRIIESDFLNRSCAFEACLELILLGDPLKIFFRQHRPTAVIGGQFLL
jgi:hypothetical protein